MPSIPGDPISMQPRYTTALYILLTITIVGITFSIAVSSIAMAAGILLWCVMLFRHGRSECFRTPLDMFFLLYLVAEILATVFSVEPISSLVNMKRLFQISVVYLTLASVNSERRLKYILGLLTVISVALTLVELFSMSEIGGHFLRVSVFQYYLTEGGLKMFLLLMLVPFIIHKDTPNGYRVFAGVASVVMFVGLIITQTRSSWLGFIAGLITTAFLKNKKLLAAVALLIVLFIAVAPSDYRMRAASMFDPSMKSNRSRIHMLTTGWRMFLDHPVTGTGDIDLKRLYVTYIVPIDDAEGGHLHNNFIMLLVTLGSLGFLATMAMFVKIFLVESNAQRLTQHHWLYGSVTLGSMAAYVGFHVNGLFEWNFGDHEIAVFLWLTLGIALASADMHKRSGQILGMA